MDLKDNLFLMQPQLSRLTFLLFRNKLAENRYKKEVAKTNRKAVSIVLALTSIYMLSLYVKDSRYECLLAGLMQLPVFLSKSFFQFHIKLYIDLALLAFKVNTQPEDICSKF